MSPSANYVIEEPTLSILMPVYNEEATVGEVIRRIGCADLESIGVSKELVVVDDGSEDGTPDILRDQQRMWDWLKIAQHPRNLGKGAAVRTAMQHATGQILIVQDGDLEYDPSDYRQCILPILTGDADVVYGSRRLETHGVNSANLVYWLGGIGVTVIFNLVFSARLTDVSTCYKAFRTDVVRGVGFSGNKFDWEPELTGRLLRRGVAIKEVPISYAPRSVKEGKKIRWRDGVRAVLAMLKCRFCDRARSDADGHAAD